jgi:hypothetical protein
MRFFTPALYLQFNSPDDVEADRADQAWEQALIAYRTHLRSARKNMPPNVRRLSEKMCLHDAQLLGLQELALNGVAAPSLPASLPTAVVSLRQADELKVLLYRLWDRIRQAASPKGWKFSSQAPHWLYDEVDWEKGDAGRFWHRILLSDGRMVAIPFADVVVHSAPLKNASGLSRERAKQR